MKNFSMLKDRKEYSLLIEIEANLKKIYGAKLQKIILYGSYARNEQDPGSDLDVMVLLDLEEAEIREYSEAVLDLAVDLTTRYGIVVSIQESNIAFFYEWADTLPFYSNVNKEGLELYGR